MSMPRDKSVEIIYADGILGGQWPEFRYRASSARGVTTLGLPVPILISPLEYAPGARVLTGTRRGRGRGKAGGRTPNAHFATYSEHRTCMHPKDIDRSRSRETMWPQTPQEGPAAEPTEPWDAPWEETESVEHLRADEIYLGDARELLPRIPANSVSLSIWSPPYFVGKSYERNVAWAPLKRPLRP